MAATTSTISSSKLYGTVGTAPAPKAPAIKAEVKDTKDDRGLKKGTTLFEINDGKVRRSVVGMEGMLQEAEAVEVLRQYRTPFSTGFLPPGVLSVRTFGDHTQVVISEKPDVRTVCWGNSERSGHVVYPVAMPYRVIIALYHLDQLVGARLFYSPRPVTCATDPLFHANVPNLNCRGYGSNQLGVGWLCLYHKNMPNCPDVASKARYALDRASGGEPFNDGNMWGTDGPRFYYSMHKAAKKLEGNEFLWDPNAWVAKTREEGVGWTLNDDLWIPVLVTSADDQRMHVPDGVPLTLGMAMFGKAMYYYRTEDSRPMEQWDRQEEPGKLLTDEFTTAFTKGIKPAGKAPTLDLKAMASDLKSPWAKVKPEPNQATTMCKKCSSMYTLGTANCNFCEGKAQTAAEKAAEKKAMAEKVAAASEEVIGVIVADVVAAPEPECVNCEPDTFECTNCEVVKHIDEAQYHEAADAKVIGSKPEEPLCVDCLTDEQAQIQEVREMEKIK